MAEKKYYWLKLKRDFFKRHDIQIIESMTNGKDYILFYLKLLCESVDHSGNLRFNEEIPYNEQMLATITNTNIDIVRGAVKVFTGLKMMEVLDDGTFYMSEVQKMLGSAADNDNAKRQQRYRDKQKALALRKVTDAVTENNESKSIDIEIDKEIDKESKRPQKHKYGEYKHVLLTDEEHNKLFMEYGSVDADDYIQFLDEYIEMKGYKAKSHYLAIRKWVVDAVAEQKRRKGNNKGGEPLSSSRIDWIDDVEMPEGW